MLICRYCNVKTLVDITRWLSITLSMNINSLENRLWQHIQTKFSLTYCNGCSFSSKDPPDSSLTVTLVALRETEDCFRLPIPSLLAPLSPSSGMLVIWKRPRVVALLAGTAITICGMEVIRWIPRTLRLCSGGTLGYSKQRIFSAGEMCFFMLSRTVASSARRNTLFSGWLYWGPFGLGGFRKPTEPWLEKYTELSLCWDIWLTRVEPSRDARRTNCKYKEQI